MGAIHQQAEYAAKKYKTRNPYELLDAIDAVTDFTYAFPASGLKGFCTILNKIKYAVINGNLSDEDKRIVAGHEAAHLILHKHQILNSPAYALKDFSIYDNSGRLELEANTFLANFLVSDDEILESMANPEGNFYFTAAELFIPPPLLAIKVYSMVQRGHKIKIPENIDSKFLGK